MPSGKKLFVHRDRFSLDGLFRAELLPLPPRAQHRPLPHPRILFAGRALDVTTAASIARASSEITLIGPRGRFSPSCRVFVACLSVPVHPLVFLVTRETIIIQATAQSQRGCDTTRTPLPSPRWT